MFNSVSSDNSKKILYPRLLAVRVLTRVLSEKEALDEAFAAVSGEVSAQQMAWLQEVCSGTLRWKGRLDSVLDSVSLKKKPSGWLRKVLLIAAYQLIAQDRTHAGVIVSETVDVIRSKEGEFPAKFANACLRKIAEHGTRWRKQPFPEAQGDKVAAEWASMPEWLWKKIVKQHGVEWAKEYALASLERPTLWVRSKSLEWKPDWAKEGPVPNSWEATEGGAINHHSGFHEGEFIIQDISSQYLISQVTQRVHREYPNRQNLTALDLCAAPGGKSVGLAWNGFDVVSTDRVEKRISILEQTVSRTTASIQIIPWGSVDTISPPDLIWVDAPCSGTGILRRHPDVRWLRQEKELSDLIQTQRSLLKESWNRLLPGGILVYSVCSVLKEEGIEAIEKLNLQEAMLDQWSLNPQSAPFGDGFWAAILKKSELHTS